MQGSILLIWDYGHTTAVSITNFTKHTNTEIQGKVDYIVSKHNTTAVITTDGKLYTTGANAWGQTGNGNNLTKIDYSQVLTGVDIAQVSIGNYNTLVASTDEKLYGAGENGLRGLTLPTGMVTTFTEANWNGALNPIKQIFSGMGVNYILTEDGKIFTAGNHANENSKGTTVGGTSGSFVQINVGGKSFVKLAGYEYRKYGITTDGEVWIFGDVIPYKADIPVSAGEKIADVIAGNGFTLYITDKGAVFGEGSNAYGLMGMWQGAKQQNESPTGIVRCPELEK